MEPPFPPRSLCIETKKIGEIIFKSFFGEATKLQEILCHQRKQNKGKKILLLLYLLSIITNTYTNDVKIFHLFFILTVMPNMTKKIVISIRFIVQVHILC